MDAAYYDDLENKSYFYHNDRYFVFDHSPSGISLSDEGSLKTKMPWLPLPLDAVYKRNQIENGRKDLQVFVVVIVLYLRFPGVIFPFVYFISFQSLKEGHPTDFKLISSAFHCKYINIYFNKE